MIHFDSLHASFCLPFCCHSLVALVLPWNAEGTASSGTHVEFGEGGWMFKAWFA